MAVKEISRKFELQPKDFQGEAADTAEWLSANKDFPEGSTYIEVDGDKRFYKLHDGEWYLQ